MRFCLAALILFAGACDSTSGPGDSGLPDLGGPDLSSGPGTPSLTGTRVEQGKLHLTGTTSGGMIVFIDEANASVHELSLATGVTQVIAPGVVGTASAAIFGDVIAVHDLPPSSSSRPLSVWTNAQGLKSISSSGEIASVNGDWMVYLDNDTYPNSGLGTADLVLSKTDGTSKRVLITDVQNEVSIAGCPARAYAIQSLFVISYCPAALDAASTSTIVASVDTAGGAIQILAVGPGLRIHPNPTGTQLLMTDSTFALSVLSLTGATTAVDTTSGEILFAPDGTALYDRGGGTLNRVTLGPPLVKTTLQASGVAFLVGPASPDSKLVLFASQLHQAAAAGGGNLLVAATSGTAAPIVLDAQTSAGSGGQLPVGDSFTADSSHALWLDPFSASSGTLRSMPVAGGQATTWGTPPTTFVRAASGSKIVFTDHWATSYGDLRSADTASAQTAPSLLANQADATYLVSPDGTQVAYTTHAVGYEGLYVTSLP